MRLVPGATDTEHIEAAGHFGERRVVQQEMARAAQQFLLLAVIHGSQAATWLLWLR